MSAFTLVYTRAAGVFPNNTVNIPYPNMVMNGTNTALGSNLLIDTGVDFQARGIKVGDTIMSVLGATVAYATVIAVNTTSLVLSANIFPTLGTDYFIYQGQNSGCYLYVGGAGNVSVITIGGDSVTFMSVPVGTIIPVQVVRVLSTGTTATNIMALW